MNVQLDHLVGRGPVAYRSNPRNWLASSPRAIQNTFADAFDGTGGWQRDSYTAVERAIGAFGLGKDTLWFAEDAA